MLRDIVVCNALIIKNMGMGRRVTMKFTNNHVKVSKSSLINTPDVKALTYSYLPI